MITWEVDCIDTLDEDQCEVYKQGVEELYSQNETIQTSLDNLNTSLVSSNEHLLNILDNANHISAYIYMFGCLYIGIFILYIFFKWLYRVMTNF
jgi:hypothetical protein